MIETLNQYKEKRYQDVEGDFLAQSFAEWDKDFTAICKFWRDGLQEAVAGAAAVQQETGEICSYLSISLLLSSRLYRPKIFMCPLMPMSHCRRRKN